RHFTVHLFRPWMPSSTRCQHFLRSAERRGLETHAEQSSLATRHFRFSAAPTADPHDSPRSCSTFREGGLEGLREWNPNRPVSRAPAGVGRYSRLRFARSLRSNLSAARPADRQRSLESRCCTYRRTRPTTRTSSAP